MEKKPMYRRPRAFSPGAPGTPLALGTSPNDKQLQTRRRKPAKPAEATEAEVDLYISLVGKEEAKAKAAGEDITASDARHRVSLSHRELAQKVDPDRQLAEHGGNPYYAQYADLVYALAKRNPTWPAWRAGATIAREHPELRKAAFATTPEARFFAAVDFHGSAENLSIDEAYKKASQRTGVEIPL